jgi:hypothetical protein
MSPTVRERIEPDLPAEPFPQKDARFARGVQISTQSENDLRAV